MEENLNDNHVRCEPIAWVDIDENGCITGVPRLYSDGSHEEHALYLHPNPDVNDYIAGLEKDRKQLQEMLNQERTENEHLLGMSLETFQRIAVLVPRDDKQVYEIISLLRERLGK